MGVRRLAWSCRSNGLDPGDPVPPLIRAQLRNAFIALALPASDNFSGAAFPKETVMDCALSIAVNSLVTSSASICAAIPVSVFPPIS